MPKKITLISTLMVLFFSFIPIRASAAEKIRYWTVDELIKMNDEREAEKDRQCSGDPACEREFYEKIRETDSKENMVLDLFTGYRILITQINPEKEAVSVLYHDVDDMMREFGETTSEPLDEFHLVWLESYFPDPRTDFTIGRHPAFVDQIHNGELGPETHFLMTRSIANDGPDWITPNIEVEFTTHEHELSQNYTGTLFYAARINRWEPFNGYDYGSCLEHPAYTPGMTCHFVFYENSLREYLPEAVIKEDRKPKEEPAQALKTTTGISEVSREETSISVQTTPEKPADTPRNTTATTSSGPTPEAEISTSTMRVPENTPNSQVEVPLAANSSKLEKEASDFPWWLLIFIIFGITIIIWWFVPIEKVEKRS